MPSSDLEPKNWRIGKLLDKMEEGDIKLPAFQRGFVWKQGQVIDLLDSIYRDYPIGTVLIWNSWESLRSTRNIGGFLVSARSERSPVNYVLDGQQRLTALYALFSRNRQLDPQIDEYKIDPSLFDIYFDLDEKKFVAVDDLTDSHANLRLDCLFDEMGFRNNTQHFSEEHLKSAVALKSQFGNYEIPIVTTFKRSKEDIGIIFERINNTATRLSTLDLMIAWTWSDDFHLREQLNDILEILDQKGFGDTDEKILLQCLSAIIKKTTKTRDILALDPTDVRNNIDRLRTSLENATDFLSTELNVISGEFLPQSHQLIPFTYFFSLVDAPSAAQVKILKKWFWRTSFSLRYQGATDIRLNQDILFFDRVAENKFEGIEKYSPTLTDTLIKAPTFSKTNVYTRSLLLLLAQKKPQDLISGKKIDIGKALSKFNRKEYHHIFPQAFLRQKAIPETKINSICNFCYLSADSNKRISKRAPSDYIFNLVPSDHFDEILSSNLIPIKKTIYKKNDYEEFLNQRADLILTHLDSLMG